VDYKAVAEQTFLALDAGRAMRQLGLPVPEGTMRSASILGKTFDPAQPAAYLASQAIRR
jgi:nitrate/nitrite transport system substrate-binding protein